MAVSGAAPEDVAQDGSPLRSREIANGVVVALPSKTIPRPRRSTSGRLVTAPSPERDKDKRGRQSLSPVEDRQGDGAGSAQGPGGSSVMLSVGGSLEAPSEGDGVVHAVKAASKLQKRVRVPQCAGGGEPWGPLAACRPVSSLAPGAPPPSHLTTSWWQ